MPHRSATHVRARYGRARSRAKGYHQVGTFFRHGTGVLHLACFLGDARSIIMVTVPVGGRVAGSSPHWVCTIRLGGWHGSGGVGGGRFSSLQVATTHVGLCNLLLSSSFTARCGLFAGKNTIPQMIGSTLAEGNPPCVSMNGTGGERRTFLRSGEWTHTPCGPVCFSSCGLSGR